MIQIFHLIQSKTKFSQVKRKKNDSIREKKP